MRRAIAIVVLTLAAAVACGQKGPLYLPGQPPRSAPWPPAAQPAPAATTAPQAPDVPGSEDRKK
ncbi:MAG: LPS translocon maturation chaperone LptM [Gemmatimonadota bacterium]